MLYYTPYPLGHAQSSPTLVQTSCHQWAMRSASFAILTSMRVSNEHRKYTHPASAVSKNWTSLCTLTYKARYSTPFWLCPSRLVICLGKGPCLGSPKLGRKGRYLWRTGRLEIGGNAATPIPTWPCPVSTHLGTHFKQPVDYAHTKFRYPNVNEAK